MEAVEAKHQRRVLLVRRNRQEKAIAVLYTRTELAMAHHASQLLSSRQLPAEVDQFSGDLPLDFAEAVSVRQHRHVASNGSSGHSCWKRNKHDSSVERFCSPSDVEKLSGNAIARCFPTHTNIEFAISHRTTSSISTRRSMTNSGLAMISNNTILSTEVVPRTGLQESRGTAPLPMAPLLPLPPPEKDRRAP